MEAEERLIEEHRSLIKVLHCTITAVTVFFVLIC